MSRKPLDEGQRSSVAPTFNSLIKELDEPRSLVSFLPDDARTAALTVPEELLGLDEEVLLHKLKYEYNTPEITNTIEALRNNFWMEYDRVQASKHENVMNLSNVYLGVCTRSYWHKITVAAPHLFAYILTRTPEYESVMAGLLSLSTRRLRDILSIPVKKPGGELQDPKVLDLVLKAVAMVDLRNKGSIIQRSETKNLTVMHSKQTHVIETGNTEGMTAQELDALMDQQIKQIESQLTGTALVKNLPQGQAVSVQSRKDAVIDATYKDVGEGSDGEL